MPSPISHTILSYYLPIPPEGKLYQDALQYNQFFQIGSIGPDIPYGSKTDFNIFESGSELAEYFHFTKENQLQKHKPNNMPFHALKRIKDEYNKINNKDEYDSIFWFILGYISHMVADGVIHPFVVDKVGKYKNKNNAKQHRALEMGIDVLLCKHFTQANDTAIEVSYARIDKLIREFKERNNAPKVIEIFTDEINHEYDWDINKDTLWDWIDGLARMFSFSSGLWPSWIRKLDATDAFVFNTISDLKGKESEYLVLTQPEHWEQNFLNRNNLNNIEEVKLITQILDFLDETGTFTTSKRIKREVEDIPRTESVNAVDYGQKLSFISQLGLIERSDTRQGKWKITNKGKKWLDNEIDLREI